MPVRALVLRTAGTNCDIETQLAWEKAGATAERVHINRLIEDPKRLSRYQILTIPGGFS
ncbi:MAG: phosphoribosylformylglycinamidine synthase subunit PurQ, partial [Planctomycetota bacterium]|nr:phosphoribosylformylglycinamidine synthase subunit PurQ [Planctomycetota bacterium]